MRTRVAGPRLTLYRPAAAVGGGFDPTDITGLKFWYDASDTSSITESSGAVSQWNDKSGNGYHLTQSTGGSKPTTGTRTLNGLNTVAFDGTDYMQNAGFTLSQPDTVIAVVIRDAGANYLFDGVSGGRQALLQSGGYDVFAGVELIVGSVVLGPHVYAVKFNGASSSMRVDGTTVGTGDAGSDYMGGITLGARFSAVSHWAGAVCEMVAYSSLSDADRTTVENYLMVKWGFTPLTITGLAAWYDASNAASITSSSGAVSQWNDLSGNGYHLTQGTGSAQPSTGTRTQNGLNVIDFDGTSDIIQNGSAPVLSQPATIFAAVVTDSASSTYVFDGSGASNRWALGINLLGGSKWDLYAGGTGITSSDAATGAAVWSALFNTTSSEFWRDGTSRGTGDVGSHSLAGITLGGRYLSTSPFYDGAIGEFLIYSGALSTGDRQTVEAYLKAKWGTP